MKLLDRLKLLKKKRLMSRSFAGFKSLPQIVLSGDPWAEVTIPTGADQLQLFWDLTTSVDGDTLALSWEIDSTWYTQDATHNNLSTSAAATYAGSVAQTVAAPGNDTGESASGSLFLAGLHSATLYPTALLGGGYVNTGGAVTLSQGALARKTAGTITAIRLTPASGTISGTVDAKYL